MADRLGQRYGVPVHETPVGFKYVGPKMMETGAILGGEESGGFGFAGHIPERDAIVAGLYALDLLVQRGRPFSSLLD
jgi:phosphomannomutase